VTGISRTAAGDARAARRWYLHQSDGRQVVAGGRGRATGRCWPRHHSDGQQDHAEVLSGMTTHESKHTTRIEFSPTRRRVHERCLHAVQHGIGDHGDGLEVCLRPSLPSAQTHERAALATMVSLPQLQNVNRIFRLHLDPQGSYASRRSRCSRGWGAALCLTPDIGFITTFYVVLEIGRQRHIHGQLHLRLSRRQAAAES
jgi:hypothetical protein